MHSEMSLMRCGLDGYGTHSGFSHLLGALVGGIQFGTIIDGIKVAVFTRVQYRHVFPGAVRLLLHGLASPPHELRTDHDLSCLGIPVSKVYLPVPTDATVDPS